MATMVSSSQTDPAQAAEAPVGSERQDRAGIDRAFDVIRNHTFHTKGYVLTALKLIEEFGNGEDKARLNELLQSKNESVAIGTGDSPRRPILKKKK